MFPIIMEFNAIKLNAAGTLSARRQTLATDDVVVPLLPRVYYDCARESACTRSQSV